MDTTTTTDQSFNLIHPHHRRHGGGADIDEDERNSANYYDRFHLNQYYNAVEDEQIYMDEYTSMIHRYNDFIVNTNTLFTRMEQTLRESLLRTQQRQLFYYQQYNQRVNPIRFSYSEPMVAGPTDTHASAPAPAPATSVRAPTTSSERLSSNITNILPRLLSRYITNTIEREERHQQTNTNNNNIFSMLYTVPLSVRTNQNQNGSGAGSAPTNEQINRATLNTVFSNIISPINATCPISREEFNDNSQITMIRGCNHVFNRNSLRQWFAEHSTCPMCRNDIREFRSQPDQTPTLRETSNNEPAPRVELPQMRTPRTHAYENPSNFTIDSMDQDHITFSYDLPSYYMNHNNHNIHNNHNNRNNNNDDDDNMELD